MKKNLLWFLLFVFILNSNTHSQVMEFDKGDGSVDNPYLIEKVEHLNHMVRMMDEQPDWSVGKWFRVNSNITQPFTRTIGSLSGAEDGGEADHLFRGNFDGGNFIINLQIKVSSEEDAGAGLFGAIGNGAVLTNIITHGQVEGFMAAGGIVGYILQQNKESSPVITISNCSNLASVTTTAQWEMGAGGIVGAYYYEEPILSHTAPHTRIMNCVNLGKISGTRAGGIIGEAYLVTITNCFNGGHIEALYYPGRRIDMAAGGIVGKGLSTVSSTVTISNSINTAPVTSSQPGVTGGLAGE